MSFIPTDEQVRAAELFATGQPLRIEALAGTGKTTTLQYLVDQRARGGAGTFALQAPASRRRGRTGASMLYTSFGAKVVADAKRRFPAQCRVATNHSLAWGVGRHYQSSGRLQARVGPTDLIAFFGWHDGTFSPWVDVRSGAYAVVETITRFAQSSADHIGRAHAMPSAVRQLARRGQDNPLPYVDCLLEMAGQTWAEMVAKDSRMPVTHDIYLKQWALGRPRLNYDAILLDEAQDANAVIVGVLEHQPHAQLVIVGDRRQAIYGFRGSVDAMDAFEVAHDCALTRSWRFGPQIAQVANAVLANQCESTMRLQGDPRQPGHVGPCAAPRCVIGRTNANLVAHLFMARQEAPRMRLGVVGGVADLIKLVEAAERLRVGEPSLHPELAEFVSWGLVREAVEHEAYTHLRMLVELVEGYGTGPLLDVLESVRGNELQPEACDRLFSTAHKAKGSEYPSVKLLDDFAVMGPPDKPDEFGWTPEDGNLLYVATTRAREHLDPTGCLAVIESWDGTTWPSATAGRDAA